MFRHSINRKKAGDGRHCRIGLADWWRQWIAPDPASKQPRANVDAPVLFFAPFVSSVLRIERAWASPGDRLGRGQCVSLVDRALAELLELIGFDEDYRAERHSFVVLTESHFTYRRKVSDVQHVRLTAQLIDYDDQKMHLYVELRHAAEGWLMASGECLFVHVDLRSDEPVLFPDPIIRNLIVMQAAHARLPRPTDLGRAIGLHPQPARLN
jgi:acyl-CoA thioester hydrolase